MKENCNNYKNQKLRGLKRKYDLIMLRGCKCECCGYNKNISALEFHHINPSEKEIQLDLRHLSNTNINTLQIELNKCKLLCANCHREMHNPSLSILNIPNIISNCNKKSISNLKQYGSTCPVCGNKFPKSKGKIYCSKECRVKDKGYPNYLELQSEYQELHSWEKVAKHFNITRRIIQKIRKDFENK